MEQQVWKLGARRTGAALALAGIVIMIVAAVAPPNAGATPANTFQGVCVGTAVAGTCVLDEPEGHDPSTNGTASYARVGNVMSYVVTPDHAIQEVQICMQASGPFAWGANVCAGSHGHHVAFTHSGNVYAVDLASAGFAATDPLYWTLHVVAGGKTLQMVSPDALAPPPTTTTTHPGATTTTTTHASTTTTSHPSTTTTTDPGTTTTTDPGVTTTTTDPGTTTTTAGLVTSTTAPSQATTTTLPTNVLGETLSRTGGIQWWVLLSGACLLLAGACLLLSTRIVQGVKPAR